MKKIFKRSFLLFYLLAFYVFFQFFWWAYYLVDLHSQIYSLELEQVTNDVSKDELLSQFRSKLYMVLGEGAVFFLFLLFGMWKIRDYLSREKKLVQLQNNFILSVSHELKSPIAAIQLHLETLSKRTLPLEKQQSIIRRSLEESERLNNLTENILLASRIERGEDFFHFDSVDFTVLIERISHNLKATAGENHGLELRLETDVKVGGDAFALEVLIRNLYENAIKYSPEGSTVEILLERSRDETLLKVCDEGEGIPDDEKKLVLKKFYRVGSEEVRKTKGTGLGLFLVNEVAHLHKAKVEIYDNQPKGTVFQITFRGWHE